MNTEALKATFKRAQAWVKKNPKKAALIGVVLAVLIYFAIKQGSQSSGESLGDGEPTSDSSGLDSFGAGLSAGGESSSLGGSSGGSSGGLSGSNTTPISNVSGSDFTTSGGFDDSSFGFDSSFLPELPASGFVNSSPAFPTSSASILSGASLGGGTGSKGNAGIAAKPNAPTIAAPKGNAGIAVKPVSTPAPAKSSNTLKPAISVLRTDAEKAGLSKYFTGTSGGKRYVAGVYVGLAPAPAKSSNTLKPASKPTNAIRR